MGLFLSRILISYFITLVPKKLSHEQINDFRPNSLKNVCLKFLTKMAADRFQRNVMSCVHKNQYGLSKAEPFMIVCHGTLNTCTNASPLKGRWWF
jgi:hypothetical protein